MENVNDSFFDGSYKHIWKALIPAELTVKETDFMLSYFSLGPHSRVLDLMCGYGRNALALAEKGVSVTAVDNLAAYIDEVKETAAAGSLPVTAIQANAVEFTSEEQFDLAICMGNSLNFFNAEDVSRILANLHRMLRPGGQLLINSWSIAEIAIRTFAAKSWSETAGYKILSDAQFLFQPTRIEYETTLIAPNQAFETSKAIDYIFSLAEIECLLKANRFSMLHCYSIPGRKKFALGDPRVYIVSEKI